MEILDAQKQRISRFGISSDQESSLVEQESNSDTDTLGMFSLA